MGTSSDRSCVSNPFQTAGCQLVGEPGIHRTFVGAHEHAPLRVIYTNPMKSSSGAYLPSILLIRK
jgi:hypothetical protein